jgi:hypothetical protein
MLKSRSINPPGGWRFTQPETGWKLKPGHPFKSAVASIIEHRRQNPRFKLSTDFATVEVELDNFTCALLRNDPKWCDGPPALSFPKPLPARPRPVVARGNAAVGNKPNFLANTSAGIKLWLEFFGSGKPETKEVAEKRASVCVTCPQNVKGNILERFNAAAGREILAIFNALNDLDLHTSQDKELYVCHLCSCPLRSKVFAPLEMVKKHMVKETMDSLPDFCWIKQA